MCASSTRTRARDFTARDRADYSDPGLRVSDAERAEVCDRLSKHYGDGRLDEAEFNERVDRAMKAKTRSDLNALFTDLPPTDDRTAPPAPPARRRSRHPVRGALFIALALVIAVSLGPSFFAPIKGIVWLAVLATIALLVIGRVRRNS
jgi:hypothetical protein